MKLGIDNTVIEFYIGSVTLFTTMSRGQPQIPICMEWEFDASESINWFQDSMDYPLPLDTLDLR